MAPVIEPCSQILTKEAAVLDAGKAVIKGNINVKQKVDRMASAFGAALVFTILIAVCVTFVALLLVITSFLSLVAKWMVPLPGADKDRNDVVWCAVTALGLFIPVTIKGHYEKWKARDHSNLWLRWICNVLGSPSEIEGPKKVWAYTKLVLISIMASLLYACAVSFTASGLLAYGYLPWPVWVKCAVPLALALSALTIHLYNARWGIRALQLHQFKKSHAWVDTKQRFVDSSMLSFHSLA